MNSISRSRLPALLLACVTVLAVTVRWLRPRRRLD